MSPRSPALECLVQARLVFWDFDGVIKESVDAKSQAFVDLFAGQGPAFGERVRAHHLAHGGVSRFEKIPLYLQWAGFEPTRERVDAACQRFSALSQSKVIDSPWVAGVRDYLEQRHEEQDFVLVTAIPEAEASEILRKLQIDAWFRAVYGSPGSKKAAVGTHLARSGFDPLACAFIGDAQTDLDAAGAHGVPFVLRLTGHNRDLIERVGELYLRDLSPWAGQTLDSRAQ